MKVTEMWKTKDKPTISFELFPARDQKAAEKLEKVIDELATLKADFIITNYFYDNRYLFEFVERCRKIAIQVPILPGVMPIYSVKMMENLARLCDATITPEIRDGLSALPEGDNEALTNFGIDFATKQCKGLLEAGVPGLHFYTMDRAKSAVEIVKRLREANLL